MCIRERVVKTTIEEHQRGEDFDATENDVPVVVIIIAEAFSVLVNTARAKRCRCRMSSFLAPSFSPYYALKNGKKKSIPYFYT